ncbi:hypothetical protein PILCRDRAFT_309704 [Piloderma croceum F 1598]|uniref:Uncharacterized protein n=1 Tax=Piloderma croceum (strain F 1598) TaxID=765440 RepID=A0A0C3CAC6_PILCF|nr:hypothetical protein PILCRDRAFT_309704 [Piloderma croceum F 1598]
MCSNSRCFCTYLISHLYMLPQSFNRIVVSADLKRFKFYGDRVRDLFDMLYFNTPDETRIDPAVFRALSRRDTLLPNLRRFRWWECKEARLMNARFFLGPKLESFAIRLLDYGSTPIR